MALMFHSIGTQLMRTLEEARTAQQIWGLMAVHFIFFLSANRLTSEAWKPSESAMEGRLERYLTTVAAPEQSHSRWKPISMAEAQATRPRTMGVSYMVG